MIDKEMLFGAVARGWCTPSNAGKIIDTELINAIVDELESAFAANASTEPAQATGNPRDWLIDGSLLYRLGDDGANCDEVNITMIHGSRNQEDRAAAAACLLHVICASEASASPVPRDPN